MFWIALHCPREEERLPWGWRALQFTPRVAQAEDCVLLEASASEQLFGGRRALLARLLDGGGLAPVPSACGSTALVALALLRLKLRGTPRPARLADLPLDVLTAAAPHVDTLERTGCRTWGELRALPRGGVARRFGAALLEALDAAHGERPERYDWITLPEAFDLKLELVALATTAPDLMGAGQRLLDLLQAWLQARNRGVLAFELEWTLDLRRLDGKLLPPTESLQVRTAQPTQDMAHLRRLANEQLARAPLAAPANHLRLRTLETLPWAGASRSFLPDDNVQGERLHQLVERLGARLGPGSVTVARPQSDHRPERMQAWVPARDAPPAAGPAPADDALYPAWVLPQPLPLEMRDDVAWYGGPLRPLTRVHRVETAWWEEGGPALRDYYIAHSETAGLVWVYREQPLRAAKERWFLQGLYA